MRRTRQVTDRDGDRPGEILVSVRPEVLDDAEHAVGNLLQRIHHTARVSLAGVEAEHRDRVRGALTDLESLLELLFDYVSPVEITSRPTDASKVASSMVSQVRAHAGESVELVGQPQGKVLADPRILSRSFQLIGNSLGSVWKEAAKVAVDVAPGTRGQSDGFVFDVRSSCEGGVPVGAAARVALAVARRLIEMQGGELEWSELDTTGACRVVLPRHGESGDGGQGAGGRGDKVQGGRDDGV